MARDDRRLDQLEAGLAFFAPETKVIALPAWDTVPYDRVSPNAEIVSKRITALETGPIRARVQIDADYVWPEYAVGDYRSWEAIRAWAAGIAAALRG